MSVALRGFASQVLGFLELGLELLGFGLSAGVRKCEVTGSMNSDSLKIRDLTKNEPKVK